MEHGGTNGKWWFHGISLDFMAFFMGFFILFTYTKPLNMTMNDHRNSGFTHAKRVIVQTVNVYQRVILLVMHLIFVLCNAFVLSSFAWMLMGFLWDDCGSLMDLYWILCRTLIEVYNF